jgi:hypothetical protein
MKTNGEPNSPSCLAVQDIAYTSRETIIDSGPFQATAETKKTIHFHLWGGLALVGGIVLVA